MANLSKEWSEYDHNCEKVLQDIKTRTGIVYINCWPTAGRWYVLKKATSVPDGWVTHTRLTHTDVWN